jgi:uncharacterized protein YraI
MLALILTSMGCSRQPGPTAVDSTQGTSNDLATHIFSSGTTSLPANETQQAATAPTSLLIVSPSSTPKATPTDIPAPIATRIPTGTDTPTAGPTSTFEPCQVALVPDGPATANVYAGPAITYPVIGVLQTAQYVTANGVFYPGNSSAWLRVDYFGTVGWVPGFNFSFNRDGCSLPVVDFTPLQPNFTQSPTAAGPEPTDTATP